MEADINYLTARNEVLHAYADHAKDHSVFGAPTGIDFTDGIQKMAQWASSVGARKRKETDKL